MGYQPPRQFPPRPQNGHGPRPSAPLAAVPIVGQPIDLHTWFPTVSFSCRCQAPAVPLLAVGLGTAVRCPACGTHWGVTRLDFDAANPQSQITVSRVGRSDAPPASAPPAEPPPSE
jgi:hypothetical protein